MLRNHIVRGLEDQSIDLAVLETMPFKIVSSNDLELGAQVIAQAGIAEVFGRATSPDRQFWTLRNIIQQDFPEQMRKIKPVLFEVEANTIVPTRPQAK